MPSCVSPTPKLHDHDSWVPLLLLLFLCAVLWCACLLGCQIVDFGFESGIVDLSVGEATVGSIDLTFLDPKTNSPKPQGATKPSVIQRHLRPHSGVTAR